MARLQESAQMSEWVAKEDDFHLEQSRRRAAIRVRENRAKPIDLLAINLKWADPMVGQKKKKTKGKGKEKENQETAEDGLDTEGEEDDEDEIDEEEDEDEEAGLEIDLEEPYTLFDVSTCLRMIPIPLASRLWLTLLLYSPSFLVSLYRISIWPKRKNCIKTSRCILLWRVTRKI